MHAVPPWRSSRRGNRGGQTELKQHFLDELYRQYLIEFSDKETVLGCGNIDTKLLMIGEAPGKDEVRLSRPFSGKAGGHLDEFLEHMSICRDSIYITNAIKYRLAKADPKTGRISNRPAARDEITQCRPWLLKEINIIRPQFIITLGNVPLRAITGSFNINIGDVHGKVVPLQLLENDYKLFALYHPASIIYNRSLRDVYLNDLDILRSTVS